MKIWFAAASLSFASMTAFAADAQPTDAQIDAAFKKADPDGDGTVSLAEAKKFGITAKAFAQANPDKDGTLDKKEFLAAITYQSSTPTPTRTARWTRRKPPRPASRARSNSTPPIRTTTARLTSPSTWRH